MVEGEWDVVVVFPVSGPLFSSSFVLSFFFALLEKGGRRDILLFLCSLPFEKIFQRRERGEVKGEAEINNLKRDGERQKMRKVYDPPKKYKKEGKKERQRPKKPKMPELCIYIPRSSAHSYVLYITLSARSLTNPLSSPSFLLFFFFLETSTPALNRRRSMARSTRMSL